MIPLRLSSGGVLPSKIDTAFVTDGFVAYEQFTEWRVRPEKSVDVYLEELCKLAVLFGGISDRCLACAFLKGLPNRVKIA